MNQQLVAKILLALAHYYTLTRAMLQALCLPGYDERSTRRILLQLLKEKLINKTNAQVVFDAVGTPPPVYYPSRRGCDFLHELTKDDSFLTTCCATPNWQHLWHWVAVAKFHILLDQSCAKFPETTVERWFGEWQVVNSQETEAHKRFLLNTLLREKPRLVFAPDAGFLLNYRGYRRAYYLERDRSTSGINQVAASKTPGVAELWARKLHDKHFPGTKDTEFRVLLVTDTPGRRDALRKAIATKPGASLWRFSSLTDLTPATFLHEPVWYRCPTKEQKIDDVVGAPLIKRLEIACPQ